jgi:hypothetical protein
MMMVMVKIAAPLRANHVVYEQQPHAAPLTCPPPMPQNLGMATANYDFLFKMMLVNDTLCCCATT